MPKTSHVVVVLVVLVFLGVAAALFVDFDAPELGTLALRRLGHAAGIQLTAAHVRLNLLKGLELEGAELRTVLPSGRLVGRMPRLVLAHRLLPLLRGRIVVDRLLLLEPDLELVAGRGGHGGSGRGRGRAEAERSPQPSDAAATAGVTVAVAKIEIRDGSFSMVASTDDATTRLEGLDLELRDLEFDPASGPPFEGLSARGRLAADRLQSGGLEAIGLAGEVWLAGGHLSLPELGFTTASGPFRLRDLDLDLRRSPFDYSFRLEGGPLDGNLLLGAPLDSGFGPARVRMEASGSGSDPARLQATGKVELEPGTLGALPLFTSVEALLSGVDLVGIPYETTPIRFRVLRHRVRLLPFVLTLAELELEVEGWVDLDGPLDLSLRLVAPRETASRAGIPEELLVALATGVDRVAIPLIVTGTRISPAVSLDRSALAQTARQSAEEVVRRELKERLQQLLGRPEGG